MIQALPFAIHVFGALPHQRGRGASSECVRSAPVLATANDEDHQDGPVVWLVKDGKALNAQGRELLKKAPRH